MQISSVQLMWCLIIAQDSMQNSNHLSSISNLLKRQTGAIFVVDSQGCLTTKTYAKNFKRMDDNNYTQHDTVAWTFRKRYRKLIENLIKFKTFDVYLLCTPPL